MNRENHYSGADAKLWQALAAHLQGLAAKIPDTAWRPVNLTGCALDVTEQELVAALTESVQRCELETEAALTAWLKGKEIPALSEPGRLWLGAQVEDAIRWAKSHVQFTLDGVATFVPFPLANLSEAAELTLHDRWICAAREEFIATAARGYLLAVSMRRHAATNQPLEDLPSWAEKPLTEEEASNRRTLDELRTKIVERVEWERMPLEEAVTILAAIGIFAYLDTSIATHPLLAQRIAETTLTLTVSGVTAFDLLDEIARQSGLVWAPFDGSAVFLSVVRRLDMLN